MANLNTFFDAICNAVEPLEIMTYLNERASATKDKQDKFLVVSLPSRVTNKEIGGANSEFNWSETTTVFNLFVKDDISASNPNESAIISLNDFVDELIKLFPIVDYDNEVILSKPTIVIPAKSDGNGFHYTRVHAELSTMV